MKLPIVNIIVPCYNVENYIAQCLDSLLAQTYTNIKIICINDGSSDSTLDIIERYARTEKKIVVINQKNKGVSAARNVGLSKCERDSFVLFVDADDWVDSQMIESCIRDNDDVDVILMRGLIQAWNDGRTQNKYIFPRERCKKIYGEQIHGLFHRVVGLADDELKHPEYNDSLSSSCLKIYRYSIICDNNIEFGDCAIYGNEDWLFNVEFFMHINAATIVPYIGYYYRRTPGSYTRSGYRPHLLDQWQNLYNRVWSEIKDQKDVYSPYRNHRAFSFIGIAFNSISFSPHFCEQVKKIEEALNHPLYKDAFIDFPICFLSFPWKVYFFFVKKSCAVLVTIMVRVINISRHSPILYNIYKKLLK